jgi:hypothetical protein
LIEEQMKNVEDKIIGDGMKCRFLSLGEEEGR